MRGRRCRCFSCKKHLLEKCLTQILYHPSWRKECYVSEYYWRIELINIGLWGFIYEIQTCARSLYRTCSSQYIDLSISFRITTIRKNNFIIYNPHSNELVVKRRVKFVNNLGIHSSITYGQSLLFKLMWHMNSLYTTLLTP